MKKILNWEFFSKGDEIYFYKIFRLGLDLYSDINGNNGSEESILGFVVGDLD